MLTIPSHHRFTTTHPIDNVPAGATGLLKRLDKYHIALLFDDYEDLVFDVNDTDLPKLSSIQALAYVAPTRSRCALAARPRLRRAAHIRGPVWDRG